MADPMDLNAVDSARFASGLNIEPVVAGHTSLRQAITDHYNRLASWVPPPPVDVSSQPTPSEGLPVPFELMLTPFEPGVPAQKPHAKEAPPAEASPFSFFTEKPAAQAIPRGPSQIIHQRSAMSEHVRPLEGGRHPGPGPGPGPAAPAAQHPGRG